MARPLSFEGRFERLQQSSAEAFKGMEAAEAAFLGHARPDAKIGSINFPLEEGLLEATIALLGNVRSQGAMLTRDLDAAVARQELAFERLFDKQAGRRSGGFLRRSVPLPKSSPAAIASKLTSLLLVLNKLDLAMREAKPVLGRHHRQCEYHLLQMVDRREKVDSELDSVGRELIELNGRLRGYRNTMASAHSLAALTAAEQEVEKIEAEHQAVAAKSEVLSAERDVLVRLIGDIESFVDALNAEIGAANVMAAKVQIDVEHSVGLLKAVGTQAPDSTGSKEISELMSAFDANPLSGLELHKRRLAVNAAFDRHFAPGLPLSDPEQIDDAAVEDPSAEGEATAEIAR